MLYEITQDCRISNNEYKKGDVVTIDEVGQYFTTVMRPLRGEKKQPVIAAVKDDANEVKEEPKDAEEVEEVKEEPKKASKKKK